MMWGNYDLWSWFWMVAATVVFWGAVIALFVWVVRSLIPRRQGDPAMETLRRRLAAGEITEPEFERARQLLQGSSRSVDPR